MRLLLLSLLCLVVVGCEKDYSGHVKLTTTAGEVKSVTIKLPNSGSEFQMRDQENVQKLILELEEITKQLRDAKERMPKKETAK
jgi:hypothetical protein